MGKIKEEGNDGKEGMEIRTFGREQWGNREEMVGREEEIISIKGKNIRKRALEENSMREGTSGKR